MAINPDPVVLQALAARLEGRSADALHLLMELFRQADNGDQRGHENLFITLFEWSRLAEAYRPAYAALASARDEQARRLLGGEEVFGACGDARRHPRFKIIIDINKTLKDSRSTYDLFVQLVASSPSFAQRVAFLAELGREQEAESLRNAALAGIASDELRALAKNEIAAPGAILRKLVSHQMSADTH